MVQISFKLTPYSFRQCLRIPFYFYFWKSSEADLTDFILDAYSDVRAGQILVALILHREKIDIKRLLFRS